MRAFIIFNELPTLPFASPPSLHPSLPCSPTQLLHPSRLAVLHHHALSQTAIQILAPKPEKDLPLRLGEEERTLRFDRQDELRRQEERQDGGTVQTAAFQDRRHEHVRYQLRALRSARSQVARHHRRQRASVQLVTHGHQRFQGQKLTRRFTSIYFLGANSNQRNMERIP